jgi:hypothetical protein
VPHESVTPAYIAGFFDGEGCVTIRREGKRGHDNSLQMGQNEPYVLERILEAYPGGHIYPYRSGRVPHHSLEYAGPLALDIAKAIFPYAVVKRHELWTYLAHYGVVVDM